MPSNSRAFTRLTALVIVLLLAAGANAQVAGGAIGGTVLDASGAALPNAKVTIQNAQRGTTTDLSTNANGVYRAPNLVPGRYHITVSAPGFATLVQREIVLTVGDDLVIDLRLKVGGAEERLEVTSLPPAVDTATSAISSVVDASTLRELPLNGRDWTALATLQPGVASVRTQAAAGLTTSRGNRGYGDELTISGHRPQENNYRIDGVSINDYSNGAPGSSAGVNLGVDAIAEFSVLTTSYTAEYGRTSGGVINAITSSGTNSFHGSGFEFIRDDSLDARNYFDPATKSPLRRHQFGGSAGGPIRKDKTFIFGSYEGIRRTQGVASVSTVPSVAARQGRLAAGTVTVDPAVVPYLDFWPTPNGPVLGNGDTATAIVVTSQSLTENFWTTRIDHHFSAKDNLFGTYLFDNASFDTPDAFNNEGFGNVTRRQLVAIEETHIFNQRFINSIRVGYNRTKGFVNAPGPAINSKAGDIAFGTVPNRAAPIIAVTGLSPDFPGGVGANSFFDHIQNSYQLYDDAFVTKGNHSLKLGFAFEKLQYNLFALRRANGRYVFSSLANFLTNKPSSLFAPDPARSKEAGLRQSIVAGYFQDNWRMRPNLTLNLGLRYEMSTNPTEAHNGLRAVRDLNGGPILAVDSYFTDNPTLKNFEPRLGFAWDPFGNGKTAIRAGIGLYDHLPLLYIYTPKAAQATPFQVGITLSGLPAGSFPKTAYTLANFANVTNLASSYIQPNPPRNYVPNWNLSVIRELPASATLSVAYVGSRGIHNAFTMDDANIVLPVALTAQGYIWPTPKGSGTRQDPNAGVLRSDWWDGDSYYHALQAMLSKRMSHSFQAQASYTWSKCTDTGSAASRGDQFLNGITSPLFFDKAHRKGLCDFNVSHIFTLNSLWDVPGPKTGFASAIFGNWEIGNILNTSTGVPFTVTISGDPLGLKSDDPLGYPNRVNAPGCNTPVNPGNPLQYIKVSCFAMPTPSTLLGNSGRNIAVGPGLFDLDLSLYKNIPIRRISEVFRVQFRTEFFNILNHTNFAPPPSPNSTAVFSETGVLLSSAGKITSTQTSSRQVQLGVRVSW